MAAIATFALKAGVWFRRGRLLIVSPDSLGTACPLSGRNSTFRPVQILEAGSVVADHAQPFHLVLGKLLACAAMALEDPALEVAAQYPAPTPPSDVRSGVFCPTEFF